MPAALTSSAKDKIRTFIAFPISKNVQDEIAKFQNRISLPGFTIRWIEPETLNLTLFFLGSVQTDKIIEISHALNRVCQNKKSIPAEISQFGAFPSSERPNILWLGLSENNNMLENMFQEVNKALMSCGFKKETRPFLPHITIGRVKKKSGVPSQTRQPSRLITVNKISFEFRSIKIYKSTLAPHGAVYEGLHNFDFNR